MRRPLLLVTALLLAAPLAGRASAPTPASPAVRDVNGAVHHPLDLGRAKAAVLIFIANDCPISNGYAPEINRICAAYRAKGVAFYLVDIDPDSAADKQHARDYRYTCPVLIDSSRALVKRAGATVTPEAAIFGLRGALLYRGRIDDRVAAYGKVRAQPTRRDLRAALDAVLAGRPVPGPRTQAIGCFI